MAIRLTKGKALIGSLDVQGALTVNGAPVGAGSTNNNPPMVYTGFTDTEHMGMMSEGWDPGMGQFSIGNNSGGMSFYPERQQNFLTENNIQVREVFDVEVEWFDFTSGTWKPSKDSDALFMYHIFRAFSKYDMMYNENRIRVSAWLGDNMSMGGRITPRFTLRRKAN